MTQKATKRLYINVTDRCNTNGNLCASWIDKERILDKYEG